MNLQVDRISGLDLPQPGSDASQLPPIHAPQTFHAPDTAIPQFSVGASPAPDTPIAPTQPAATPAAAIVPQSQPAVAPAADPLAAVTSQFAPADTSAAQAEEADTPFDEEWVSKAKEVVERSHTDPYTQSQELSKLKAQYIKARYNKDIKVSED